MAENQDFQYRPNEDEPLSMAVVSAVALVHHEDIIEQDWILNNGINPDGLDRLFQEDNLNINLQFEADTTTVTIKADEDGKPVIGIESHR